jgi:hypothetical protein
VLRLAEAAAPLGITRFALLTPYYLPTDDEGVLTWFRTVTEALPGARGYAYLFPERTGLDVAPDVLRRIMALPGMAGVKLSGGAAARLDEYAPCLSEGQELYSGDDATLPWVLEKGGAGVVSGVSAAFPQPFAALARALDAGPGRPGRVGCRSPASPTTCAPRSRRRSPGTAEAAHRWARVAGRRCSHTGRGARTATAPGVRATKSVCERHHASEPEHPATEPAVRAERAPRGQSKNLRRRISARRHRSRQPSGVRTTSSW